MKKILLFALPLLAMIAVSCEKDNDSYSGPTKLVKEIYEDGKLMMSFEYDNDKRVTKITEGDDICEFTYSDRTITYTYQWLEPEEGGYTRTLILDKNGYIIEDSDGGKFEYKNGYLSKAIWSAEDEYTYIWKNGNLYPTDSDWEYSNIKNITNFEFGFFGEGYPTCFLYMRYKGLASNNLPKRWEHVDFEYKLDDDGAPIQMIANWRDNKSIYTITYVE